MKQATFHGGFGLLPLGLLAACASAPPPRELLDARQAFAHAASSDANRLTPAAVHDAKTALDRAEASYSNDSDSYRTRDRAYVAIRKAQLAEVIASNERLQQEKAASEQRATAERDREARMTQGELEQAKQQLSTTQDRLDRADANLSAEKSARMDAEKRAREALDALAVSSALAVKEESRGTVITVPSSVLFASGKADLLPGAQAKLEPVAEVLSHEENHKIIIEGHTDSQGPDASNLELSQRRAETVRQFFAAHGVPADHLASTGVGEARPVADNATAEGRANNRRVEIIVQPLESR